MSEAKKDFFDGHAKEFLDRSLTRDEEAKLDWFRSRWQIAPGMAVIEPGCGAGRLTRRLATWVGANGHVLAFDSSPKMVAEHRRAVVAPNVQCTLASAEDVILPLGQADRVLCLCVFPHFDDKLEALRNLASALRQDGLFFVSHFHSREELNQFHEGVSGAVKKDKLLPDAQMRGLFARSGMVVDELIDEPGRYHLRAHLGSC